MIDTHSIKQIAASDPAVYAFAIDGEVSKSDMETMADYMNEKFDAHDTVSMLLIFERYDGSEAGAGFEWSSLKSRIRSISKVDKYAVVGAPDGARRMIEGMGKIIPVEARTFDAAERDAAWAFVGARPA